VSGTEAAFYFDLASPLAYLAAERILHELPGPAEWRPVLASRLGGDELPGRPADAGFRAGVECRAEQLGLQRVRWPDPFPFDSALAMRVATYAKSIGRTVPFVQAAFRQAFAGGHSLADPDYVVIAAAACEMHPSAVLRGASMRTIARELEESTAAAASIGVRAVPAIVVSGRVLQDAKAIEDAAALMGETREGAGP